MSQYKTICCFFLVFVNLGTLAEEDLYIRLIDSATKQVSKCTRDHAWISHYENMFENFSPDVME